MDHVSSPARLHRQLTQARAIRRTKLLPCMFLALGTLASSSLAQDELRPSVVAHHSVQPLPIDGDYNLKLGPVRFDMNSALRVEFNDNVNLGEKDKVSALSLQPSVGISAVWPVTAFNAVRLNTSLGYTAYLGESRYNSTTVNIAPDSELAFDMYVGNFVINFHDRFNIETDPVGEPTVNETDTYGRLVNTLGVTVFWAANSKLTLSLSYDHTNNIATVSRFSFADYASDQLSGAVRYRLSGNLLLGVEGGAATTRYSEGEKNDVIPAHGGVFAEVILSPYTTLRVAGGVQYFNFNNDEEAERIEFLMEDPGRKNRNDRYGGGDHYGYYWNFEINNRTSPHFYQALIGGWESQLGVTSQRVDSLYLRYSGSWKVNSKITLNGSLFYETGQEEGAFDPEDFNRYGAGISTSYQLSRKTTLSGGYQFIRKNSNLTLEEYTQNRVYLEIGYNF